MLLDAVEKALGRTTHIPTLAVAYEFVDSLAFDMSRKYVLLNNVQQRSSGENLFRFHRGVATLYRMFYLLFKPIRHVTYLGWTVVTVKLAPANSASKNALADALAPLTSFQISGDFSRASFFTF